MYFLEDLIKNIIAIELIKNYDTSTTVLLIIKIIAEIIIIIVGIIFLIRVWKIVEYNYFKIKDKEKKTLKEKVNSFLFREDE